MKLFTWLLFAGVLIECISLMVASPLDKKYLAKSAKATDKNQRSKREPGVALVLSIIDKNSPKIQKLQIEMDDHGYHINDRNSNIKSAAGKHLIHKLLSKGDIKIKSDEHDEHEAKKHKLEELLEILKDSTSCTDHKHHEDRHSFRAQKIKRQRHPHSSDDDKLDLILELLANLKELKTDNKDLKSELKSEVEERKKLESHDDYHDIPMTEGTSSDEETEVPIKHKPKPGHVEPENSEEEHEVPINSKPKPGHVEPESNEEEHEVPINSKPKPGQVEPESNDEEHEVPIKRKPKPGQADPESSEEEHEVPIKRKPKPGQVEPESSEEEHEVPVKRKPKPGHIEHKNSEKQHELPIKRKPKPGLVEPESSDEEHEVPIKQKPKPSHVEPKSSEKEHEVPIKRKPNPGHVEPESSEEEHKVPIKRKPKPAHVEPESSEEEHEVSIKRKPKPGHDDHENSEEEHEVPIKRKQKPGHDGHQNSEEEHDVPIKRKPKPGHDDHENSEEEHEVSIKRKPKSGHDDHENSEEEHEVPIKRKPKPGHDDHENSEEEHEAPIKRKPKPGHDDHENSEEEHEVPIKRKPKPGHDDHENSEEEHEAPIKRKPKPGHDDHENSEEEHEVPIKSKPKPGQESDNECKHCDLKNALRENSDEPSSSEEEEEDKSCADDDLDEEQLLQGIAFVQNQLKRFLGIECTCTPTDDTVLKECPLHKTSSRHRREDQKESKLTVRSSGENDKKIIKNKKFTKKAALKDLKKVKNQGKELTKKEDSSTAHTITKEMVRASPQTTTESILKLLKELGISAHMVQTPPTKDSAAESHTPLKESKTTNEDLQFFRDKSGVHRPSTKCKSTGKKNGRKLRNRRKGRKGSSTRSSTTPKRTQRGITSEEIAAKQEERTSLRNYETEANKEEILLSRPVVSFSSVEEVLDSEIEGLKSLYDKYKERVAGEVKRKETDSVIVKSDDDVPDVPTSKDIPGGEPEETEMTESVENILKQISKDHADEDTHFPEVDDSSSEKEYVIAHDSDSNYRNLYSKFTNMFGDKTDMDGTIHSESDGDK